MFSFSHLHQLFNAATCQSYIHALRWKDRPLQCPRCQSHNVGPWGTYHYQPGLKRYRCKENACKRTFNDLTGTLLDGSKRSLMHWILATFLLCLSCSSHRITKELGVHVRTGYRWCWWLRNAAVSYEMERQLEGTVEADDLYHTAGNKGQAQGGGKKSLGRRARGRRKKREPGRGHYDKDRQSTNADVPQDSATYAPTQLIPIPWRQPRNRALSRNVQSRVWKSSGAARPRRDSRRAAVRRHGIAFVHAASAIGSISERSSPLAREELMRFDTGHRCSTSSAAGFISSAASSGVPFSH